VRSRRGPAGKGTVPIALPGPRRLPAALGAVLALRGAARRQLDAARALTRPLARHCILVAVDGGLDACRAWRRRPDLFVGDGDSTRSIPAGMPAVIYRRDKDHSDLAGALVELQRRRVRVVGIAGLLGGRVDHEWANLLEVGRRARSFALVVAPAARGTLVVTARGCAVGLARGTMFSLFSLASSSTVTLTGARWTLRRRRLLPGSHGLSNLATGRVRLAVHSGTVALLLPPGREREIPG